MAIFAKRFGNKTLSACLSLKSKAAKQAAKSNAYLYLKQWRFSKNTWTTTTLRVHGSSRCDSLCTELRKLQRSIKLAGLRAGLWRFKTAQKGQTLSEGEHLAPDGRVYRLKASSNNQKGTVDQHKQWITEGKMTTTHTVGKHTFVSLAGLHDLSLDDCAEQCGTDPTTIRDFYHGTLGDKLRGAILGEKKGEPWQDWIKRVIDPLYTKRYNELMSKGKTSVDLKILATRRNRISRDRINNRPKTLFSFFL